MELLALYTCILSWAWLEITEQDLFWKAPEANFYPSEFIIFVIDHDTVCSA